MKCQDCGSNEAFVHLSKVVEGDVRSFWLCTSCADARQAQNNTTFPTDSFDARDPENLASFLGDDFLHPHESDSELPVTICPSCDYDIDKWRETNLLGCPRCYQAFSSVLYLHLSRFHGHATHFGKTPLNRTADQNQLSAIKKVRIVLEKAVAREDFEEAALQRDLLKALKSGKGVE